MRFFTLVPVLALVVLTACEGTRTVTQKDADTHDDTVSADGDTLIPDEDGIIPDEPAADEDQNITDEKSDQKSDLDEETADETATDDDAALEGDDELPLSEDEEPVTDDIAVTDDATVIPDDGAIIPDNDTTVIDDDTATPDLSDAEGPDETDITPDIDDIFPVDFDLTDDDQPDPTDLPGPLDADTLLTDDIITDIDDLLTDTELPDVDTMLCTPYEMVGCPYSGDPADIGHGPCTAGVKECAADGMSWGACWGEVLPEEDVCGDLVDNDCDGHIDEGVDLDGDGWGSCADDCCDTVVECANPELVNGGALEVPGDGVDNDCDGATDEALDTDCSTGDLFTGTAALDLIYGMDICQHSTDGSWGIVGTPALSRASGAGTPSNLQIALMTQFGTDASNIYLEGGNMAVISSGRARDAADTDPTDSHSFTYEQGQPPADFIAAHAGVLPSTGINPVNGDPCTPGDSANDGVMVTVQLKVPTNAFSFSFNYRFFTQGYWRKTCKKYNDFFIAMLYTGWQPGPGEDPIPADRNIAFDSLGNYISVNTNEFFTSCEPQIDLGYPCPDGTAALEGTGYKEYANGALGVNKGGATQWLSTTAPVVPGETITLKFVIWDTTDMLLDSLVLIDNFQWSTTASGGPITAACWDLNMNGACEVLTEDVSGDGLCSERDC